KKGEGGIVIWKLGRFIDELRKDYGHDKTVAPIWEFRSRADKSRVLTYRVRDAGINLAKRDIAKFNSMPESERRHPGKTSQSEGRVQRPGKTKRRLKGHKTATNRQPRNPHQ